MSIFHPVMKMSDLNHSAYHLHTMVVRIHIYKYIHEKVLKIKEGGVSVLNDTQCASLKHIH